MEVEGGVNAERGQVELNVAKASDAAHLRIYDRLCECARDCCIDRVAASAQNIGSDLNGFWLWSSDHAFCHRNLPVWRVLFVLPAIAKGHVGEGEIDAGKGQETKSRACLIQGETLEYLWSYPTKISDLCRS